MKTAVQLVAGQEGAMSCRLIFGEPERLVNVQQGVVAVFGPQKIVAYMIDFGRRRHGFLFRTAGPGAPGASMLVGIWPKVELLVEVRTAGRVELVRRMFAYLIRKGRRPSELSDGFYVRVGQVLGGRRPEAKVVEELLRNEDRARSETILPASVPSHHSAKRGDGRRRQPPHPEPNR